MTPEPRLLECRACDTAWSDTMGPTCDRCGALGTALYPEQDDPPPTPAKEPRRTSKPDKGPRVTEADFQRAVIDLLRTFGYRVAHFRPGMTGRVDANGKAVWVTPVQADGKGFPDLIAVSEEQKRCLAIELKRAGGRCTIGQAEWLAILRVAGVETYVWTTADRLDALAEIARQRPARSPLTVLEVEAP